MATFIFMNTLFMCGPRYLLPSPYTGRSITKIGK